MKTILLAITLFVISISCFAQSKDVKAKNILRYPNELRGFKLMKTSKLKVLVPSVSTAEEVRKFYGERKSKHKRIYGHYHKRSNVETTFSMIKAKFGGSLRSKTRTAQINEALCKILAHNICVLIQSIFELGVKPDFYKE